MVTVGGDNQERPRRDTGKTDMGLRGPESDSERFRGGLGGCVRWNAVRSFPRSEA